MRWLALVALGVAACAAPSPEEPGADASAAPDVGARDAGSSEGRDAGAPDAGSGPVAPPADSGRAPQTCMRDAECPTGVCRHESTTPAIDLEPVPLFCGEPDPAPDAAPGEACRDHAECDRDLCAISGACVIPCRSTGDCGPGEICREVWVRTGPRAMQHTTACTRRVTAPDGVRVAGPEPGPAVGSDAVRNRLPALGRDALVVWQGPEGGELLIERIEDRTADRVVYDAFSRRDGAPDWGIGGTTVRDVATLLFPNGPRTPVSSAGFDVFTTATRPGPSERLVFQRTAQGNVLDLDLYLVGAHGWTSVDGTVPSALEPTLGLTRRVLAQAGIELRDVRVHDVVGGLRARYGVLEGSEGYLRVPPELDALYRLTAGATRPSMPSKKRAKTMRSAAR